MPQKDAQHNPCAYGAICFNVLAFMQFLYNVTALQHCLMCTAGEAAGGVHLLSQNNPSAGLPAARDQRLGLLSGAEPEAGGSHKLRQPGEMVVTLHQRLFSGLF
jgi:hypothetical protein